LRPFGAPDLPRIKIVIGGCSTSDESDGEDKKDNERVGVDPDFHIHKFLIQYRQHPNNIAWVCDMAHKTGKPYQSCMNGFTERIKREGIPIILCETKECTLSLCIPCYHRYASPVKSMGEALMNINMKEPLKSFTIFKNNEESKSGEIR